MTSIVESDPLTVLLNIADDPRLADHGFRGMTVVPGATYLERTLNALSLSSATLRNIQFTAAAILSDQGTLRFKLLTQEVESGREVRWQAEQTHATLVVAEEQPVAPSPMLNPQTAIAQELEGEVSRSRDQFYDWLRRGGNEYGPRFQRVERWSRMGAVAVSRIDEPAALDTDSVTCPLDPPMLDACIQTLAALKAHDTDTFVLSSIDELQVYGQSATSGWIRAVLHDHSGNSLSGDITLWNDLGHCVAAARGVRLQLFQQQSEIPSAPATPVTIAANFTAEPVADTLHFWGRELNSPWEITFAPYNQVFQQLIHRGSELNANRSGFNATLLCLDELGRSQGRLVPVVDEEEREAILSRGERHTLPAGGDILHLNKYETEYLYKEIFTDGAYFRHGIELPADACVVDIGANIGMFTLAVLQRCADPTIYAFEPSPQTFEVLSGNAALYGRNVHVFNCGVSDRSKQAIFTFYENSSVFSGFQADEQEDAHAILAVIENMLSELDLEPEERRRYAEELFQGRLDKREVECPLVSLSDVIAQHGLERIDLVKLDAEKSELDVLRGISEQDWPKIRQIVVEVHDSEGPILTEVLDTLKRHGFSVAVEEETLLERSGLFNVFGRREGPATSAAGSGAVATDLDPHVDELIAALETSAQHCRAPHVVVSCPPDPEAVEDEARRTRLERAEVKIAQAVSRFDHVQFVASSELFAALPVETYFDPDGHRLGHVSYTPEFYAALGTLLSRRFQSVRRAPYKVLVLDCDNTLWGGVCGEVGPHGIDVGNAWQELQEFAASQQREGMLICLCSKNDVADVDAVFAAHPHLPLQPEQVVARRINWRSKSENLRELAEELNLGLDSFIFVDDNPVECAEVMAHCPEVLTVQLPDDPRQGLGLLKRLWAFDRPQATREDLERTQMYRDNVARQQMRHTSLNLADFIDSLNLSIEIRSPGPGDLPRLSQLTQRTNQFNASTIRRSEAELRELLDDRQLEARIVSVRDRFGDYGQVGALLLGREDDTLLVDTLLLSCRSLGRGVEHAMLRHVGEMAVAEEISRVVVPYCPTPKNEPARRFLDGIAHPAEDGEDRGDRQFAFSAEQLSRLVYDPDCDAEADSAEDAAGITHEGTTTSGFTTRGTPAARLFEIARDYDSVASILAGARARVVRPRPPLEIAYCPPRNAAERAATEVWERILSIDGIGVHDRFAALGGSSLQAVQLIVELKRSLGYELTAVDLFEHPTVASLLERVSSGADTAQVADSRSRGTQRRERTRRVRGR